MFDTINYNKHFKNKFMSSIGPSADAMRKLLNNQKPFSNLHPDYVEDKEADRNLQKLNCISKKALHLQNTFAIEEEDDDGTTINRDNVDILYKMILPLLTPEQISELNCVPSLFPPFPATVSDDAYNHVHSLHIALQTWERLQS